MGEEFSETPIGSTTQNCPLAQTTPEHWLEIELLGEDDKGIAYAAYQVKLESGELIDGFLDDEGFTRLSGLTQGGTCQVSFPEYDKEAWAPLETKGTKSGGA